MSFRLLPKSTTLNDFGRRHGLILRYFTEFGSFGGPLRQIKLLKIDIQCLPQKCNPKF